MITAHIASLPDRVSTLEQTIDSLINQVDDIYVSLNNYMEIPAFLEHYKIHPILTDNTLGDAAKFLKVSSVTGYVFICDDDLIYPPDYVEKMSEAVDAYKCPVSLLGKIYGSRPIKSFRSGFTNIYRCLCDVDEDAQADIIGTGAMAYHTNDIVVNVSDFSMRNMADIWMARLAHAQGVRLMVMAHPRDYVKHVLYKDRIWVNTIDDTIQTALLNSFLE